MNFKQFFLEQMPVVQFQQAGQPQAAQQVAPGMPWSFNFNGLMTLATAPMPLSTQQETYLVQSKASALSQNNKEANKRVNEIMSKVENYYRNMGSQNVMIWRKKLYAGLDQLYRSSPLYSNSPKLLAYLNNLKIKISTGDTTPITSDYEMTGPERLQQGLQAFDAGLNFSQNAMQSKLR